MTLAPGTRLGPYVIDAPLGAGGMGVVYLAEDERLHRKVALKFLPPSIAQDTHARARFLREAQAASALDHPNIATIYEIGDWDGQPFIAMAYYEGETLRQRIIIPGLEHLPPVSLHDFWIDRYESNKAFMQFVADGGYRKSRSWRHEFIHDGHPVSWEVAMAAFRDATGRPGPATWELGTYPAGQEDYPVTGVSWYEAAAFAEFTGKSLPTIYHWSEAARPEWSVRIVPSSNFSDRGPTKVGSSAAMSRYGTYDMAGNVKEWCFNPAADGKRYILGGGWNEPVYMFNEADAQSPFSRSATFGFRCVKYVDSNPLETNLTAAIASRFRDYGKEKPVTDQVFSTYKSLYSYDRTDLKSVTESVDAIGKDWRREKVSFAAAYGNERMSAYLFLPKSSAPPYQTIVLFPGSWVLYRHAPVTGSGMTPIL